MKEIIKSLIILFLLVFLFSCSNDDNPVTPNEGSASMHKANDEEHSLGIWMG